MLMDQASAFATIVGLVSAFSTSKQDEKSRGSQEFMKWLLEHNHVELVNSIRENQQTSIFVKALLNKELPGIQSKLDSIMTLVSDLIEKGAPIKFLYGAGNIEVTYDEKVRSNTIDIVKINCHDHFAGVAAEYAWLSRRYPGYTLVQQALTTLSGLRGKESSLKEKILFDKVSIKFNDGIDEDISKDIYFDISLFFSNGRISSSLSPDEFLSRKLDEAYGEDLS